MKRIVIASLLLFVACAAPALGQGPRPRGGNSGSLKATLLQLEKDTWRAWEKSDRKFFDKVLSVESIQVSPSGVDDRAAMLNNIAPGRCEVRSWSIDDSTVKLMMLDADAAVLTYKASQDATCGGQAVPATVWATSIFVRRGRAWQSAHHQETAAM